MVLRLFVTYLFLQSQKRFGFENAEREILELVADEAHAEPVSDGRINLQSFSSDALLLGRIEVLNGAHVMQAIGQLDDHHAHVVDHRQHHFADVFGLAGFGSQHVKAANFGDTFDQPGSLLAEAFLDASDGKLSVFDDVMKKRGSKGGGIHAHVGKDVSDFQQTSEIWIAGAAELVAVSLRSDVVSATNQPRIVGGPALPKLVEELV